MVSPVNQMGNADYRGSPISPQASVLEPIISGEPSVAIHNFAAAWMTDEHQMPSTRPAVFSRAMGSQG